MTRPTLAHYVLNKGELQARADDLFSWIEASELNVSIHKKYPLREAEQAHWDLQSRATSGKLLLVP